MDYLKNNISKNLFGLSTNFEGFDLMGSLDASGTDASGTDASGVSFPGMDASGMDISGIGSLFDGSGVSSFNPFSMDASGTDASGAKATTIFKGLLSMLGVGLLAGIIIVILFVSSQGLML